MLGGRLADDPRVQRRVCRRLGREPVRLLVAAEPGAVGRRLAEVLPDDRLLVGRVEALVADLDRVAEAAGHPVAPVLGRAGGVVELVGRLADVAVLRRHRVTERLQLDLVDRAAVEAMAGGRSTRFAVGVVGDHHGHGALGDELAHRVGLRLAARAVAAEGVARPSGAGPAATPEAGVVAVEVGAAQPARGVVRAGPGDVRRGGGGGDRAVLALHLVVERAEVTERCGAAGDLEAVDVDHGDEDHARPVEQTLRAAVAAGVGLEQVEGELDGVLGARPLPAWWAPIRRKTGLPSFDVVGVAGDLDAADRLAEHGRVREG